ncbi:hypothetical protein AQUCO_00900127v1 [Aquilegia coerulea]|uniref:Homeobox domain-containing protein n=1 Tax=Aquilegia coerulea TaxID=218851 RepID=A0A2G5EC77_AQUCA|nr:hypothetical protein AQUCO_00900127v1 [Aquilegia coerulea]
MELGLSLGETTSSSSRQQTFTFVDKPSTTSTTATKMVNNNKGLGFCMSLGLSGFNNATEEEQQHHREREVRKKDGRNDKEKRSTDLPDPSPLQLDLLPIASVPRNPAPSTQGLPWLSENAGSSGQLGVSVRGFDVNQSPSTEEVDDGAAVSSPNSTVSSFQIDFSIYRGGNGNKRDSETAGLNEAEADRTSSKASDDDENGSGRKKLRLSKEQSAFLEESFKEHNTLNPKQKLALSKQLNLRPRQVEVWFQNRRARTKLKQTEVDCEYLKRRCDFLTEENRRLHKEIQELRALKSSQPYYMQLPATTLTMCPSCERVATTTPTTTTTTTTTTNNSGSAENSTTTTINTPIASGFSLTKPRYYPFSHPHPHQSAAPS